MSFKMFPNPQELNPSSCTCYIYCLSWWKSNWILPFNKTSLHTTPQRLPQRWHHQYVPEWSAVPCILNSKRRFFDIFTSLEYIVEEQLGQPISLLGNRLSEFASFKLSLISFFILPFKIHIISLNCIIFVQHYLENQVPHQVYHLHHLLWDCWIHEDVFQQTHYLNHLSDSEATLLSQKLLSLQLLKSSRLINKRMIIFSIPLISLKEVWSASP